jgi:hypothetical protein
MRHPVANFCVWWTGQRSQKQSRPERWGPEPLLENIGTGALPTGSAIAGKYCGLAAEPSACAHETATRADAVACPLLAALLRLHGIERSGLTAEMLGTAGLDRADSKASPKRGR